jgi:hypothetical protein
MKKKDKSPLLKEVATGKGKRNKRTTACIDKKRGYWSCGICGSENLVRHGVYFCNNCGDEQLFIIEGGWFFGNREEFICSCDKVNQQRAYYLHMTIGVNSCVDCNAVEGPLCPNCKRRCWSKGTKRHCKHCGYRS